MPPKIPIMKDTKKHLLKDLAFWNLLVTFTASIVLALFLAIREESFRRSLSVLEHDLNLAQLSYLRCGYNSEIDVRGYSPAYCLSFRNNGPSTARDLSIVLTTWDPYLILTPVRVSPPYDNIIPRVSPDGSWMSYAFPSLPIDTCFEMWIEFDRSLLAKEDFSESEFRDYIHLSHDDLRVANLDLRATCFNCLGQAEGDLLWPPTGVTPPPIVLPGGSVVSLTLNSGTPLPYALVISYRDPCPQR